MEKLLERVKWILKEIKLTEDSQKVLKNELEGILKQLEPEIKSDTYSTDFATFKWALEMKMTDKSKAPTKESIILDRDISKEMWEAFGKVEGVDIQRKLTVRRK